MRRVVSHLAATALAALLAGPLAQAGPCEDAAQAAESRYELPAGLLLAIGKVESGRWDSTHGRLQAWPWSIDDGGVPFVLNTRAEAEQTAQALLAQGHRSIDVGCFQINLSYHPQAFGDLRQAFEPEANADYAARFLVSLKDRLGDWPAAVAAYHSASSERGLPYQQRVLAAWSKPADPVSANRFGIHIWVPSSAGSADSLISGGAGALPHVITP